MPGDEPASFHDHFQDLQDPRVERTRKHPLINIVFIAVCGVLSGANSFAAIHEFGCDRRTWFARYLDLTNGIPSDDTFGARPGPPRSRRRSRSASWAGSRPCRRSPRTASSPSTARRSAAPTTGRDGKAAIHMVSAWATENKLSLGQVVVDEKSNEITAIPRVARAAGRLRGAGDDRRDGLPEGDRRADPRRRGRLRPGGQAEPADALRAGRGGDRRRRWSRTPASYRRAPDRREGPRPPGDADVCGLRRPRSGRSGGAVAGPERRGDGDLGADRFAGPRQPGGPATTS